MTPQAHHETTGVYHLVPGPEKLKTPATPPVETAIGCVAVGQVELPALQPKPVDSLLAEAEDPCAAFAKQGLNDDEIAQYIVKDNRFARYCALLAVRYGTQGLTGQDIAQQAAANIFGVLSTLRKRGVNVTPGYIGVTAKRAAIDHVRPRKNHFIPTEYIADDDPVMIAEPNLTEDQLVDRVRTEAALRQLGYQDRLMVTMWMHDASIQDIMATLGMKESAVKTRLFRARARLRELLAPPDDTSDTQM